MLAKLKWSGVIALALAALAACGSSDDDGGSSASCTADPWSCGAGKTCWPADVQGTFACLPAAATPKGGNCTTIAGQATCGEAMFCFPSQSGSTTGTCMPFCSTAQACAGGEPCVQVQIQAPAKPIVNVCMPQQGLPDGGAGGAGGSGGSDSFGGSAGVAGSAGATPDAG